MGKRSRAGLAVSLVVLAGLLPASAAASNLSHPATYTGSTPRGGLVEFDVSADGTAVTRFAVSGNLGKCGGPTEKVVTEPVPIVNDAFSWYPENSLFGFSGSFTAPQQAQGVFRLLIPHCQILELSWIASTPTAPPPPDTTAPPPPDTTAPATKIANGPAGLVHRRTAKFRFASTEPGSTFECKLDRGEWSACRPPRTYRHLREGHHVFRVKAIDAAGNVDPTPAKRAWRVEFD